MDYTTLLQNESIKNKVLELIPEWKNTEFMAVPYLKDDEFLIGNSTNKTILYQSSTNQFTIVEQCYRELLPSAKQINNAFVCMSSDDKNQYYIFGRITGLYYLLAQRGTPHSGWINEYVYYDESEWTKSIELVKKDKSYTELDIETATCMTSSLFDNLDTIDKFNTRFKNWYLGKWKMYTELGILSDTTTEYVTKWVGIGHTYMLERHYTKDNTLSFEEFEVIFKYTPYLNYECDEQHCDREMYITDTYYCKSNPLITICKSCYSKQNKDEYEPINDTILEFYKRKNREE